MSFDAVFFPLADVVGFFFKAHTLRSATMLNEITVLGADFAVVGAEPLGLGLSWEALRKLTHTSKWIEGCKSPLACVCVCVCVRVCVCVCVCVLCVCVCVLVCERARALPSEMLRHATHTRTHDRVCTRIHAHIITSKCVLSHLILTHTHTLSLSLTHTRRKG